MITEDIIKKELLTCFYNREHHLPSISYSSIGLEVEFNGDSIRLIFSHPRLGLMVLGIIDRSQGVFINSSYIKLMNECINYKVV